MQSTKKILRVRLEDLRNSRLARFEWKKLRNIDKNYKSKEKSLKTCISRILKSSNLERMKHGKELRTRKERLKRLAMNIDRKYLRMKKS